MTMVVRHSSGSRRLTLGADKAYDVHEFVDDLRDLNVTPHIAQNTTNRSSAIDTRTTRHPGYAISQQKRKRTEEPFARHRPKIVAMASHRVAGANFSNLLMAGNKARRGIEFGFHIALKPLSTSLVLQVIPRSTNPVGVRFLMQYAHERSSVLPPSQH
jgi:hypothetical protein